jgi:hypothetical protein
VSTGASMNACWWQWDIDPILSSDRLRNERAAPHGRRTHVPLTLSAHRMNWT